ncbi:hypothetical protein [Halostella sp. PRR32]|uniref:hypothetical protein n=1 Tax=Halostella sp. PRR32 TaxID=3098147 RepID=UPI00110DD29C|nr:hypothetical protein [Halostella sp. PRR32]
MEREVLMLHLRQAFGGTPAERRAVARAATDLTDSEQFEADRGDELTPEIIVENLADCREGTPAERWNWWMGALEAAYGGYEQFVVTRWNEDDAPNA